MAEQERRVYIRLALDAARMTIWDSDFNGGRLEDGYVTWTKPSARLIGITSDGFRHHFMDFISFVHPEDRKHVLDTFRHAAETKSDYELEYRVIWPDQSVHWLGAKGAVLSDAKGTPSRTLGIIWDITARKLEEERRRLALDAAKMIVWEWEIDTGTIHLTGHGARLFGLKSDTAQSTYDEFLKCIHADDRERVDQRLRQAGRPPGPTELEYRIIRPDGGIRWISVAGFVQTKNPGKVDRFLAILTDITERKEKEIALRKQMQLTESTLRSIGDGIMTTDINGNVVSMNRIAEQLTGWPRTLANGNTIDRVLRIVDEVTGSALENPVLKTLRLKETVSTSSRSLLLARDGRKSAIRDSASPIRSENGEILGAVIVFHDVSHERRLLTELSWQATHDPLTGLINRREFEKHVVSALSTAKRERDTHALLYMDLDQFKIVNDTCGHVAGDELLRQLSGLLQSHMRESDVLARLGGDELGALLLNCPIEQAHYFADDLRQLIREFRFVWNANQFELGVSIGLVGISEDSKSLTELMSAADMACYAAKEEGRNRVHLYSEPDITLAKRYGEMMWVSRIAEAFDMGRFKLFSQPIASLNGDGPLHSEILLRMEDDQGRLILPGAFIPAAERYDLMPSIDRWVIEAVLRHLKKREVLRVATAVDGAGAEDDGTYSINLSGISLNDDTMLKYISGRFEEHGISPERICFEITETAAIGNLAKAKHFMEEVKKLGCRFSLDDFGSGLSSFTYLKNLPVDYLKIDGSFIKDIAADPIDLAMVVAINEVGHVMGIKTIAEFVENDAILQKIREIGVDYAQGYTIGEPEELRYP